MSVEHAIQLRKERELEDARHNGGSVDGKPSNPKDAAATSRLDTTLFPMSAIALGAMGMTEGNCKYGGYNYRKAGVSVSTYIAALDRHKAKFYNGEWADKKSKVPHLGSMLSCIAIIVDGFVQGNIVDDRPPAQDIDSLLTEAEAIVKHLQKLYPNGPKRITAR
jgi:hypothetical protein